MCYNTYIFCDDLEVLVKYFIIRESMVGANRYDTYIELHFRRNTVFECCILYTELRWYRAYGVLRGCFFILSGG